jgi:hypothetical protein
MMMMVGSCQAAALGLSLEKGGGVGRQESGEERECVICLEPFTQVGFYMVTCG